MKKEIHGNYFYDVPVQCICGNTFTVAGATVAGPIKVESCHKCNPVFNKGIIETKVVKGRMEKYQEKQKKIESLKTKKAK